MAEELAASRENDARVAVAMGCTVKWIDAGHGPEPTCHCPKNEFGERPHVQPGDLCTNLPVTPWYTTDPALVVPMMERLHQLAHREDIHLDMDTDGDWHSGTDSELWWGATANLAVAAALLAVWEQVKGGTDG